MPQRDDPRTWAAKDSARTIRQLEPGPLAELRRMDHDTGAPAFWRLAARHPRIRDEQEQWIEIVRILAILTPRGDVAPRPPLHDPQRRLGEALCDGGDPGWVGPTPMVSEPRLTQLMAARGPQRAVLLTRAARMLARTRKPGSGVDVVDVAYTLLKPEDGQRLAKPYYRRLDRAERHARTSEEGTD